MFNNTFYQNVELMALEKIFINLSPKGRAFFELGGC
jgi:hypothetical protein